jgi:hypothetical protein
MAAQPVTIHLPGDLYSRVQQRAQEAHRSIEDEVLALVQEGTEQASDLPEDLVSTLDQLTLLDDDDLWRAARSHLAFTDAERLEALHLKRQRVGLDLAEENEQTQLARAYERFMLIRAQAASLLSQRGHDVSSLLVQP